MTGGWDPNSWDPAPWDPQPERLTGAGQPGWDPWADTQPSAHGTFRRGVSGWPQVGPGPVVLAAGGGAVAATGLGLLVLLLGGVLVAMVIGALVLLGAGVLGSAWLRGAR